MQYQKDRAGSRGAGRFTCVHVQGQRVHTRRVMTAEKRVTDTQSDSQNSGAVSDINSNMIFTAQNRQPSLQVKDMEEPIRVCGETQKLN